MQTAVEAPRRVSIAMGLSGADAPLHEHVSLQSEEFSEYLPLA